MSLETFQPDSRTAVTGRSDISQRTAAVIAGAGYVVLFVLGLFANFFVRESLVGNAQATATNRTAASGQGR